MEIRDPIHGPIAITPAERRIIDHPLVQRLRRVRQLGFGEQAFPGATHTRFLHSIGTMHLAGKAFDAVARDLEFVPVADLRRIRATVRLAGLLHDLGHPPLSHGGERILPRMGDIAPGDGDPDRTATHEEVSAAHVSRGDLADLIRVEFSDLGVKPGHVASLISPGPCGDDPFVVAGATLMPLLRQLVSSDLDVDRMDYLARDSYFTGVAYGKFDKDWLLSHMGAHRSNGEVALTLDSNAIFTFEDFLLSRFHMFLMVYFHHKTMAYQRLLERFLEGSGSAIRAPADPDAFSDCDDEWLFSRIRDSADPWADRIAASDPLALAVEAWDDEAAELEGARGRLESELPCACEWVYSEVEFSRYFDAESAHPAGRAPVLHVRVTRGGAGISPVPVDRYGDRFLRSASARRVVRVYAVDGSPDSVADAVAGMIGRGRRGRGSR